MKIFSLLFVLAIATKYQYCSETNLGNACKLKETCCARHSIDVKSAYGCCPFENGVCCGDDQGHCCPIGYPVCDVEHKKCRNHMGYLSIPMEKSVSIGLVSNGISDFHNLEFD
mmetsp:Transcript_22726/g.3739  ORF Transcript_22726/g.3739 Transcript_22726/m.3739 type:complete len:113 (-) Transcript_22726:30-368(-)